MQSVRRSPHEAAEEAGWLAQEIAEEAPSLQTCEFFFCFLLREDSREDGVSTNMSFVFDAL